MIIDKFMGQQIQYPEGAVFEIQIAKLTRRRYVTRLSKLKLCDAIKAYENFIVLHGYAKRLICRQMKHSVLHKFVND